MTMIKTLHTIAAKLTNTTVIRKPVRVSKIYFGLDSMNNREKSISVDTMMAHHRWAQVVLNSQKIEKTAKDIVTIIGCQRPER